MQKRYMILGLSVVLALALAVPAFGGPTNPLASISASVKSTANKALKKAKTATQKANAAQSTADAANAAADKAQKTADKAQTTATTANTAAGKAQTTATTAGTAAAKAQTTANEALAAANKKLSGNTLASGEAEAPDPTNHDASSVAVCAAGQAPTGGGFIVNGAENNTATVEISSQYVSAWIVGAESIKGNTGTGWTVEATAVCVTTP
jgi:FKBP-type peptidyl-prolyl cis-trans isomerase